MNRVLKLVGFNPLVNITRGKKKRVFIAPFKRQEKGKKIPIRKPIWFPTAPSKLYVIKEKPFFADDEREQFEALDRQYKDSMRSLQGFLYEECYLPAITAGGFSAEEVDAELDEQARLFKENDEENERQRQRREAKTTWLAEKLTEEELINKANKLMADVEEKTYLEERIKHEIERSHTYITADNLEEHILKALDNPVNYEYAIDLEGKVIWENKLHPYAFKPSAIPETSDQELEKFISKDKPIKLKEHIVYK